jgi:hypothetical protein|tara:strand:- start:1496 stop:2296 length:801 start_codon:yes stop_codon:yes gene_type:complete
VSKFKKIIKEDWWSDLSPEGQAKYLKSNPNSKKAQSAKKKKKDEPSAAPSWTADDMDSIFGTRNQSGGGWQKPRNDADRAADDEADDMKTQDAQDSRDAEDRKDAGIKPIKDDKDTQRMGSSVLSKIGGTQDPDRLELQGTQEADNGQTIIQWKDKEDGMMVGVDAQGNIYQDGDRQNYGIQVSTQSDVFGDDQNAQLLYKQKKARETGGTDPYTGKKYDKPTGRTGKELDQETLTIDGKEYRKINESVESKPKYQFSEFYQRLKR